MGIGVEPAAVYAIASDLESDLPAKALTNALRQLVLDGPDFALNTLGGSLVTAALNVKCKMSGKGILPDESSFDEKCLAKLGRHISARRFFWGFVTGREGRPVVRLHFWQEGRGDRVATLPYDDSARERVAARLYAKLVTPERVGDLAVVGPAEGELVVDGRAEGTYAPGTELTLIAGEHNLEVRQGPRVVARAHARVVAGAQAAVTLEAVAAPAVAAPLAPVNEPPRVTIRPKPSAWPWVLGGATAAGLAGAGAFWALRAGEASDLSKACADKRCPERDAGAVDRGRTWTALSAASLGVGVAAGAGLAAYLVTSRRSPPLAGALVPLPGGAAAALSGSF
jgi:hypothetical protein